MTDLEISKALALAIGWPGAKYFDWLKSVMVTKYDGNGWFEFDYRDWAVIGPIAEKFDCFPYQSSVGTWITTLGVKNAPWPFYAADTPQKAIALAVIGSKK